MGEWGDGGKRASVVMCGPHDIFQPVPDMQARRLFLLAGAGVSVCRQRGGATASNKCSILGLLGKWEIQFEHLSNILCCFFDERALIRVPIRLEFSHHSL